MLLNPYESPRPGDVLVKESMGDSDSIRQLLVEIRDAQLELLQVQREATERQKNMMRFRYPLMVIPFLIIFPVLFFTRYFLFVPPVPPRPARSVAPPIATPVNPPVTRPR
jgi:hypothetical protein